MSTGHVNTSVAAENLQDSIQRLVTEVAQALLHRHWVMGTAESCTGGGIAYALTELPGSSAWFNGGAVTYTNALKTKCLGVSPRTLADHGAVSEAVVREMAAGAIAHLECQLSVAVSGIAGPGGGTETKPVGLVCLAWDLNVPEAGLRSCFTETRHFAGDRQAVRLQTVEHALAGCLRILRQVE